MQCCSQTDRRMLRRRSKVKRFLPDKPIVPYRSDKFSIIYGLNQTTFLLSRNIEEDFLVSLSIGFRSFYIC